MEEDKKYLVALNTNIKLGPSRFKKLLNYFGSAREIWEAKFLDLKRAGMDEAIAESIFDTRSKINPEKEYQKVLDAGIRILTQKDKEYPKILLEISDPPAILYIKGEIKPEDELAVGVVGTRRLTNYGRRVTPDIVSGLARAGVTIASGLAFGIDTLAHKAALASRGRTIAILAGGIDQRSIFPPINLKLSEEIAKHGAVISEQHIGTPNYKHFFPIRNRIISGMTLGTLVVEAAESSGALITAKSALDQDREVFAVPGSIYSPASIGPNNLIRMGAKLAVKPGDILNELNIEITSKEIEIRKILPETVQEKSIYDILETDVPSHIDKIAKMSKMNISEVASTLTLMEMKGIVKNLGSGQYVRK